MNADGDFQRLGHNANPAPGGSLLGRLLTIVVGSAALVGALVFSAVLFVILALIGLIVGAFLWWKTRALRKQMREQMTQMEQALRARQSDRDGARMGDVSEGEVIEGEFVRERRGEDAHR